MQLGTSVQHRAARYRGRFRPICKNTIRVCKNLIRTRKDETHTCENAAGTREALKISGLTVGKKIVTSQDKGMVKVVNLLATDNVPKGFKKWQLPFVFDQSQLFISVGNPDVTVDEHSHDEGDGIRFIMSGSIYYGKTELKAGDWMYIPKGTKYSFTVGPVGTLMCYCYECCCVPRRLNEKGWVINPDPFTSTQKRPA